MDGWLYQHIFPFPSFRSSTHSLFLIRFDSYYYGLLPLICDVVVAFDLQKDVGIVPNKEGTGAKELGYKIDKTHYIIVLNENGNSKVDSIHKLGPDKVVDIDYDYLSLLAIDEIYSNHLGETSSHQELAAAFGTIDKKEIVKQIIIHGKYQ